MHSKFEAEPPIPAGHANLQKQPADEKVEIEDNNQPSGKLKKIVSAKEAEENPLPVVSTRTE